MVYHFYFHSYCKEDCHPIYPIESHMKKGFLIVLQGTGYNKANNESQLTINSC